MGNARSPRGGLAPLVLCALGCGAAPPRGSIAEPDDPRAAVAPARRFYALRFEGALVGFASEEERIADGRRQLVRREVVQMRRGDELASFEIELRLSGAIDGIATSLEAVVRHCTATEATRARLPAPRLEAVPDPTCPAGLQAGPLATRASAERTAAGWQLRDERGLRTLPAEAQPAEWLDVAIARREVRARRGVEGPLPLFFATRQFAAGRAVRRYVSADTWVGTVELDGATLESTVELDADDRPRLIVDSSGVVAERLAEPALTALLAQPLPLPDLVALTTLPITGTGYANPARLTFTLPRAAPLPPDAPGQRATLLAEGWRVDLVEQPDSPFTQQERDVVALLDTLARRVAADDPLATPPAPDEELPDSAPLGEGSDCTARALRLAALAEGEGPKTRIATGFIVDGLTLVRHRWVVAWTGARWISVDPSAGDAPAAANLVTLAIHDATAAGLAAAEAAFIPLRGATVSWAPRLP